MTHAVADSIEQIILPSVRDLGEGFKVRRALPSAQRRTVGPFIFLDGFGPVIFGEAEGMDTRPHPHIGLATVTYLLEGALVHRDSEGFVQEIRPGDVNLMTAGRGIVHSERSRPNRPAGAVLSGFQGWLALPTVLEETNPGFQHVPAAALPASDGEGVSMRLLAGSLHGMRAPTRTFSDIVMADVVLADGARFRVDAEHVERAIYVVSGAIEVAGQTGAFGPDRLVAFRPGAEIVLRASGPARLMLLGGEPLEGRRHIYWNFVSSRRERVEQAARDWQEGRFPSVPGETEFIPLPQAAPPRAA